MKIYLCKGEAKGSYLGRDFYNDMETFSKGEAYQFRTETGHPVKEADAKRVGFELDPEFKFPLFRDRKELGDYLANTLELRRGSNLFMKLYAELGTGLEAFRHEKAEQPGARPIVFNNK